MKSVSKYQRKTRICQIIMGMLQVLLFLFLPIQMREGKTCGLLIIVTMITKTGFQGDYLLIVLAVVLIFLHLLRFFLLLKRRRIGFLYNLPKITCLWFILSIFVMISFQILCEGGEAPQYGGTMLLFWLFPLVSGIEFFYCRYQETMEEKEEEILQLKEIEQEKKAHQKKADYFPGKYPKEFYIVIRKLFRARLKVQGVMMLAEGFTAAYLFIVLSLYGIMKETYEMESGITGDGLYGLFRNLGAVLIVLSILMMTMLAAWYMREVRKDYRLFVILGIRRRTAYMQFLLEYWGGVCIAGVAGLIVGAAGASVIRIQLQKAVADHTIFPEVVTGTYIGTGIFAYLLLMLLALAFNQENFLMLGRSVDRNEDLQRENRFQKGLLFCLVLGILFLMAAIGWYSRREWAETFYIHILTVLALFLLLSAGMAFWMKRRERKAVYYNRLEKAAMFYHRFWSNVERLFMMAVIQFLSLGVFAVSFAGAWMPQDIEEMYPYDIVVTAYEAELPKLEEIAGRYDAEVRQYPMLRMTSIYGSEKLTQWRGRRPIQWPQGQQIAISETTYQQMREFVGKEPKELHLDGEEIHVVYQQDLSVKTHTIEYDTARTEKHLRFGQPLQYYNTADFRTIFPDREIAGEERDSLIGIFHQGKQDNLIVLSDDYFEKNYDRITAYNRKNWETRQMITKAEWRNYTIRNKGNLTEGPTTLFCMNLDKDQVNQAASELEYLKEEQDFDTIWDNNIQPFYLKSRMIVNTESEIFFTRIANGFILLIFLILGLFQYFAKIKSEEDTWKWENIFLKRLGMREKERKSKIRYQMKFFILMPMLSGFAGAAIFVCLTAKARLYTGIEFMQFTGCIGAVYLIWILAWTVMYLVMQKKMWRFIEKE